MKRIILLFTILFLLFFLTSCKTLVVKTATSVIFDKYTSVESEYNWVFKQYKTYTAYWFVLENSEVIEVNKTTYFQYNINDTYEYKYYDYE